MYLTRQVSLSMRSNKPICSRREEASNYYESSLMLFYYIPIASLLIFYFVITTTNINVFYDTHHKQKSKPSPVKTSTTKTQHSTQTLQHQPILKPKTQPITENLNPRIGTQANNISQHKTLKPNPNQANRSSTTYNLSSFAYEKYNL